MMRIAFIVPQFPSISQTFVLNQITGLLDRGHEVEIFALRPGDESKVHRDVEEYGLLRRTTYLTPIPAGRLERGLQGVRQALHHLPRHPGKVLGALNVFRFGREAASFSVLLRVLPFLDRGPFDIIHCHFGVCGNIGVQCLLTGVLRGRVVTTFHGFDLTSYVRRSGVAVYRTLFQHGHLCLPLSDHWKGRLIEMGCRPGKIVVHRMGVQTGQFEAMRERRREGDAIRVLSVARLVEKKGIRFGIQAISKVVKSHPNVEYLIAGDGPLRSQFEQLAESLGLEGSVRLLGWKSQEEVADLMANADILMAPSVTGEDGDQEGIPVVLMEALAMGLPVISTHHSGIPELIIDGKTGLLAPERDSEELAHKILQLIGSDQLASELRFNGRRHVQESFDIDRLNDRLVVIFERLLNGKSPSMGGEADR